MSLIKTEELLGLRNAWMNPNGKLFVDVDSEDLVSFHETLAAYIIMNMHGLSRRDVNDWICANFAFKYNYEYLESIGWIRLIGWGHLLTKWVVAGKLTAKQERTIKDWCLFNKKSFDSVVDFC